MFKAMEFSEQGEQMGNIIEMLAEVAAGVRKSFEHQQSCSLDEVDSRYLDLSEEIAFDSAMIDELMIGKQLEDKVPKIRYQKMLAHLQAIDNSLKLLADVLRIQMKDGILLFDREMDQIAMLLERQEKMLRILAEVVRKGDGKLLKKIWSEFRNLASASLTFAATYESRLAEGLCIPQSAPIFLTFVERLQTLVHNEVEAVRLMSRWIWVRITVDREEKRVGHFSYGPAKRMIDEHNKSGHYQR